jgi:hypothetical protein
MCKYYIFNSILEMFYEAKEIDNQLLCKQCEGRLDIPKILPCGETICSFCETSIDTL